MRLLPLLLALVACHKPPATLADAALTDAVVPVEAKPATEVLTAAAESLDPTPRARALYWLIRTDDVATWGPRAAYDPSPWVQRVAVDALTERGAAGEEQLLGLATRAGVDPSVRAAAALELPQGSAPALHGAWREAPSPWDRAPLALAAHHHGDADALDALARAVATGELHLDLRFVEALAPYGGSGLQESLRTAQRRVEEELGSAIAAARLAIGDPRGEGPLRDALNGDVGDRMEALDILARLDHPEAVPLIRRARGGAPELVQWYVDLLLVAREGVDPGRMLEAQQATDPEVRRLAVGTAALALTGGSANRRAAKAAHEVLMESLSDPDATVRQQAARAAGELALSDAAELLEPLLTDDVPAVRLEAAGALRILAR